MSTGTVALLSDEDVGAVLGEVGRFARVMIAPAVQRHETPLTPEQLARIAADARDRGIIGGGEASGVGIWEQAPARVGLCLSVGALRRIARVNAGVAWHLHQVAFTDWLLGRLGWCDPASGGPVLVNVQGHYGLARYALARWLRGVALEAEERAVLADYFAPGDPGTRLVAHVAEDWAWVVAPVYIGGQLQWRMSSRGRTICETAAHAHGLDEIPAMLWRSSGDPSQQSQLGAADSRTLYAEALQITALALTAIGLGAVEHGFDLAADYAALRTQGGCTINRHPAVQAMLSAIRSAAATVEAQLDRAASRPLALERTAEVLLVRSEANPMLLRAANDVVQIFGGIGYMRDAGAEKILRDVQQLRLMNGTPGEHRLFVAEWERVS